MGKNHLVYSVHTAKFPIVCMGWVFKGTCSDKTGHLNIMTVPHSYHSPTPIKTVVTHYMATPNSIRRPVVIDFLSGIRTGRTGCFQGSHQNDFLLQAQWLALLYKWHWSSPDYETVVSQYLSEFCSWHLNMSFPGTLLVFIPEPTCQLCLFVKSTNIMVDERVQNDTLVPELLHRMKNYHSMYTVLFISPINTQYSNGHYGWMITIFIWVFKIWSHESKQFWINGHTLIIF